MEENQYEFLQMLETFIGADNNARSIAERKYEALKERHDSPLPFLLLSVILHFCSCFSSYIFLGHGRFKHIFSYSKIGSCLAETNHID